MKRTNIIKTAVLMALFAGMSVAQSQTEVPKAAVYIMGNPDGRDALRMAVNNYLIKSGRYQMIAVDAIDVLAKEHIRQMSGSVSDAQIAKLGQDAGAEYVCVVERTEFDGVSYVATRMVSVENKVADLSEMAVLPKGGIIIDFVKKQIEAMLGMDVASKPAIYKPTYTITANVNPIDGGTVSRNPNQTYYAQGTVVSVTAIPADGYEFTGWSGAATSTKATLTAPIDRDLILTANFKYVRQTYTLTTNVFPSGCGYVSRSPYKETYAAGEEVDLRATPYSGYAFSGWSGVPNDLRPNTVIRMNEDKTVTANFYRKLEFQSKNEATVLSKTVAKKSNLGTIKSRKFEYYIAPKYQQELGHGFLPSVNLEGGLVWRYGNFLGIDFVGMDFSFGDYRRIDSIFVGGVGVSLGNVYDFGNQWQFVYGGSMGLWIGMYEWYEDYSGDFNQNVYIDLLAAFVKLRWEFVELTYRGLLGIDKHKGPCYNQQLMVGLYFVTNKRER